jgi:lysophospholipid acyltransferase (LPLAT)-like uncharacterized protein
MIHMPNHGNIHGRTKLRPCERALVWLLSWILRLWWGTLRVRTGKTFRKLCSTNQNFAFAFWHQHLFLAGLMYRRFRCQRPVYAVISASKDGEWLAELFQSLGIQGIRGSSHRGAIGAYYNALHALKNGGDVAITPDGPRGPKFQCKSGIFRISQESHRPICAVHIRQHCAISLKSWDLLKIPLPFSRIDIAATAVDPDTMTGTRDEKIALLNHLL